MSSEEETDTTPIRAIESSTASTGLRHENVELDGISKQTGTSKNRDSNYPEEEEEDSAHTARWKSNWMMVPENLTNKRCPKGLEYFLALNQLVVSENIELLELISGKETENVFEVKNIFSQRVFVAKEQSSWIERALCGTQRAFAIEIFDTNEEEVMHLFRQHACACCNCCCMPVMTVEAPPATVIGHVKQIRAKCRKILHVECPVGNHVATIKCPPFCCKCRFRDVPFTIMDAQGKEIGCISRYFTLKGLLIDADNFSVIFPIDLDVKTKACLMGALFLIDIMYFETAAAEENRKKNSTGFCL